jgi:antitoxin component of MazEF toxin-antitoxin module
MLKKVLKLNNDNSIAVGIPAKVARDLNLTDTDYVNLEKVGNCIHLTKVRIE